VSFVLACDLGGTSLRAALVDRAGAFVAAHTVAGRTAQSRQSVSEIDPSLWWADFCRAVDALALIAPDAFANTRAISITAITRTQVFLGDGGKVLRPAILWGDTRSESLVQSLRERCPTGHEEAAGLNAFHPLARLWWLRQAEPEIAASLAHVVEPKDYLNFCLTGTVASDTVSMARLAASAAPAVDGRSLFDAAGLDATVLPRLLTPGDIVGTVRADIAGAVGKLAGLPVVMMANDTWATVVGLGAMRPGCAYNISGTTEVLGVLSSQTASAEGLMTVAWGEGLTQVGGPSQSGADSLMWLLDLLSRSQTGDAAAELAALTADARDSEPVLFLPYLLGERVPHWDPALRGALLGLNRSHRAVDLAYAVMEGVGFLNRLVLERAEAATGVRIEELRFGGGGATNPLWCQIKADILGRPVVVTDCEEHGLLGAAITAWSALDTGFPLGDVQRRLVRTARRYEPGPGNRQRYNDLFVLFRQAEDALRPISHQLVGLQRRGASS